MVQCEQAQYYINKHQTLFDREFPNCSENIRIKHFSPYFQKWMASMLETRHPSYNPMLHYLALLPQSHACYSQCDVNGVRFVIEERDRKLKTQNSGVMVQTEGDVTYYGVLEDVIALRYAEGMSVVVFKCRWFNTDPTERGNIKIDHGLISVDTSTSWYDESPFCLASNAKQVFYVDDPQAGEPWKVVNTISYRGAYKHSLLAREDSAYQERTPSNLVQVPPIVPIIDTGLCPQVNDGRDHDDDRVSIHDDDGSDEDDADEGEYDCEEDALDHDDDADGEEDDEW